MKKKNKKMLRNVNLVQGSWSAINSIECSIETARLRVIVENSIEFNYYFYSEKK